MGFIVKILAYPFIAMSRYLYSYTFVKDIVILVAASEAITYLDLDKDVKVLAEEIKADRQLLLQSQNKDKNNPYQVLALNNDIPWISSQFVSDHFETIANTALLVLVSGTLYVIENKTRRGLKVNTSRAKEYIVDQVANGTLKAKGAMKTGTEQVKSAGKRAKDLASVKISGGVGSAKVMFDSGKKLAFYSIGHLRINAHLLSYMAMGFGSFAIKGGKYISLSAVDLFRTIPVYLTKEQKAHLMLKLVEISRKVGSRVFLKKVNGKTFVYSTMGVGSFGTFCYMMVEYVLNEKDVPGANKHLNNVLTPDTQTNLQLKVMSNHKKLFLLIGKTITRLSDIRKLQYAGSLESSISTKFGDDRDVKHAAFKMADLIISQFLERLSMKGTPSVATHLLTVINIVIQVIQYLDNPDGVKLSSLRFIGNIVNNIIDYNSGSFAGNKDMFAVNLGVKTTSHIHIDAVVDNRMSNNVIDDEDFWKTNKHRYDVIDNTMWDSSFNTKNDSEVATNNVIGDDDILKAAKVSTADIINDGNTSDVKISPSVVSNLRTSLNNPHMKAG